MRTMRFSIRYQLLLPLLALMLSVVGASAYSAYSSGQRARRQVEAQIDDIAKAVQAVPFSLNARILHLMKGMSGAEFLLCDQERRPIRDEDEHLMATIADVPDELPPSSAALAQHFDTPVRIAGNSYLCGGVPVRPAARPGAILYMLYPGSA